MSLLLAVLAAALLLTGQSARAGLTLLIVSAVHFVGLKMIIMPRLLGGAEAYVHQYGALVPQGSTGYGGILKTVLANPAFTLHSIYELPKLRYALEILAPLAFLPFRRPAGFLLALPGFFFTLLSTNYEPLVSTAFQYTSYWNFFVFYGALLALYALPARARLAWFLPLTLGLGVSTVQFGAIVRNQEARGSWSVHHLGLNDTERERYASVQPLLAHIPKDDSVAASETLVPHISNRADAFSLRLGLQGATWIFTGGTGWDVERNAILEGLRGDHGIVQRAAEFIVAKKGHPKDLNEQWLRDFGYPPPPPPPPPPAPPPPVEAPAPADAGL